MAQESTKRSAVPQKACKNICPCRARCPLSSALKIVGGKWKIPVLCALHQDGVTRYNELKCKIQGVTNAVLSKTLKELESGGLISRKQYPEVPVRVEYSLTGMSSELMPIILQLAAWGMHQKHEPPRKT
ncbi:MAG: helix-turn-helix transcriptional regulator [Treponema sp.]|jgi:DNA-binding HxlR family transcriptional regulator|nr:helix-turn-helix transcriptional regulator [Treponema sp.]